LSKTREFYGKFINADPVEVGSIDPGYRLYTDEDLSRKLVYVEASRGCPFGCEFCQSGGTGDRHVQELNTGTRKVREFPLEQFLAEMEKLIHRGARGFKFLDRTFNLNIDRARSIMEFFLGYLTGDHPVEGLYVHFEMVPSRFPPELREVLRRFPPGSLRLEVGIQTFNQKTAALIGRLGYSGGEDGGPVKELEILDFLRRETKAIVHADLIAGLPGEDMASFAEGFDRLWQVRPTEIQLGILKCLPGTAIIRHRETYGLRWMADPPYEILETAVLSAPDLDRIKNFARFWELIVNRGAFPDLVSALFPEGQPVFWQFLGLADRLRERFGRNWGIDRSELRGALEEEGR
jgi:radical SAM superfamily enzyme YgiQ (UPF0313 family)